MRIPLEAIGDSGGKAITIPGENRSGVERSDAGISIVQEVFGFVKENLSGAKRRQHAGSGERGAGKGGSPCPASAHSTPRSAISAPAYPRDYEGPSESYPMRNVQKCLASAYLFVNSRQCNFVGIPPNESMAEAELVREARQGREKAFLAIYNRHRSSVFQFAWRLTGAQSLAEDVTQECFLALVRGAAFDGDRGTLRSYLFGIARNLVLRRLRVSEREAEEPVEAAAPVDVLGDLLEAERSELLSRAISRLPVLQREAIVLFTFQELSLEEIAKITGVDAGTVKSRLHRARESLHSALAPLLIRDAERRCS